MPAGLRWIGSGATSQSNLADSRNVGVDRRDESSIARRPFAKRDSSSSASTSTSLGVTPYCVRRAKNSASAAFAAGQSSVNLVGRSSSSTSCSPIDHTNGAMRMIVGSTPTPYTATFGGVAVCG